MARTRSFISTIRLCPSTAMTPSTMPSRMAVALACSCSRSRILSRSRPAMTLRARPSDPISSGERTGACTAKSPSLMRRAMACISTTGRVTRRATKSPMAKATAMAARPLTRITCRLVSRRACSDSPANERSARSRASPSNTMVRATKPTRVSVSLMAIRPRTRRNGRTGPGLSAAPSSRQSPGSTPRSGARRMPRRNPEDRQRGALRSAPPVGTRCS